MSATVFAFLQGLFGIVAFGGLFLAPGYLWGHFTNAAGFRSRTRDEQVLWSVALSLPLAIAVSALLGRLLSAAGTSVIFGIADGLGLVLWLKQSAQLNGSDRTIKDSTAKWRRLMIALMALFGLYCIVATLDVQIGHRIFVSSVVQDWSVRVAMVKAAARSGVPPINGLSTISGPGSIGDHAPPLRYYYFWYVIVAQMARTFHLQAQAALAASCAWAGWALISTFFLALKHLVGIRQHLRAKCFVGLFMGCVLGLDIVPTAWLWVSRHYHPYPEMEWWRQDRTPSFLGSVLYAPHHMAGFACLLAGTLVLLLSTRAMSAEQNWPSPAWRYTAAALFAGTCFAAAAGTAIFPVFCFVFVLTLWAVDLVRRREWGTLAALAVSGVLALVFARGYLHELSAGSSAASGFANFRWRSDDFVIGQFGRHMTLIGRSGLAAFLGRQPFVLLMDFFEFGFYALVAGAALRRDLLSKGRLSTGRCALWAIMLGASLPFFFLSSTATSGPNDLGVDAGFLLRFALQLWAVPWVWQLWHEWRGTTPFEQTQLRPHTFWKTATRFSSAALFALGLSAQIYQVLSVRFYYAVVGTQMVHKQMDALTQDRLAERLYNIRSAWRAFDAQVPPSAPDTEAVQFNPVGAMQPVETIYSDHQIASWDTGCGTSYGGDYRSCGPIYAKLLYLYGNTQHGVEIGRAQNDRQDGAANSVANDADFRSMCRLLHVRALMAESTDSIWNKRDSWVWTTPAMVSNDTVRVLACPEQ